MADMLAIVKRTVFDKLAGTKEVGDVLAWQRYDSAAPRLSLLTKRSRLFLVTVRPPDERLWLVAIYEGLRRTSQGWRASRANTTPIADITYLRRKLKFDNGKGMTSVSGLLGNSLQTPRVLTEDDVVLLEAAAQSRDEWFEVADLDPESLQHLYPPEGLLTLVYAIGPTEHDYDYRYEDARSLLAELVNRARDADLEELKHFEFDAWIGQACSFGHYLDEMIITLAARTRLPFDLLRRSAITRRLIRFEAGRHPIVDGAYPEVKIAGGIVAGTWPPTAESRYAFSRMYKRVHRLAAEARDPYIQMAMGASEPFHFAWLAESDRLKRRAVELVSNEALLAGRIPNAVDREALVAFGFTIDPAQLAGSLEAAYVAEELVFEVLAEAGQLSEIPLGDLRLFFYWQAQKLKSGGEVDEEHLGEVLAELRRRCGQGAASRSE